jgi:cytosine/adenosine deaminase-related metal-dependent hydrolase
VLEALAASGIRARTGPWTWDQAGPAGADGLPDWLRMDADAALDRLAEGVRTVRKFNHPRILDAVTIEGVGTCSDALNRGAADLAREYDSLFVLHKSTSEAEVELELKVFGGATALRMQDQVGSLEPGKQADIVVFDTANFDLRPLHNPVANIVYGSTGHSVDTVLIGGEVVLRHKQLTSLDEAALRSEVEAINRRVLGEIGIAPLPRWPIV